MDKYTPNYYECCTGWVGAVTWTFNNNSVMYFYFVSSFCKDALLLLGEENK